MTSGSGRKKSAEASFERVVVGRIVAPHGVRGEVKVEVHTDLEARFDPGSRLLSGGANQGDEGLVVRSSRPHKKMRLVLFQGVHDRNGAEALRGTILEVRREDVPPAPEGFYYHFDLVGCRCREVNGRDLGTVVDVLEDGGGELVRVVGEDDRELLLPFVDAFIDTVDVEAGEITWRLPEGLVEICGSE